VAFFGLFKLLSIISNPMIPTAGSIIPKMNVKATIIIAKNLKPSMNGIYFPDGFLAKEL
jgi:hypothetical protein